MILTWKIYATFSEWEEKMLEVNLMIGSPLVFNISTTA